MNYVISEELVKGLVGYLQKKPYEETYQAIPALLGLKPIIEPQTEPPEVNEVE